MSGLILIVDDSPEDRASIRFFLSEAGAREGLCFGFLESGLGSDGLAAYRTGKPDCILLDHHLPDIDGLEFLAQLRDATGEICVPVVVLTGSDDKSLAPAALRAGAQEYLPKRFMGPELLLRAVQSAKDRFGLRSASRRAELALAANEERLRLTQEAGGIGTWEWSVDEGAVRWSKENFLLHGMDPAAELPDYEVWQAVIHEDDRVRANAAVTSAMAEGKGYETAYRVVLPNGGVRWLSGRGYVTTDSSGRAIRLLGINQDITAQRNSADALARMNDDLEQRVRERTAALVTESQLRLDAEAMLHHAQKIEAIGQLTGGIAHDFNNILGVIMGNLDMAKVSLDDRNAAAKRIEQAIIGVERGAMLTQRLLASARRQPLITLPISLRVVLPHMVDVIRDTLGANIAVGLVCADGLWSAMADAARLENALLNVALNARDAMQDGGRITIEARNVRLDHAGGGLPPGVTAGDYVTLDVTDTGTGMPKEILGKVFEPFFTTKGVGKGTGLGLAMVYGFAKQSGGHASIRSTVGTGTTVSLYLPRAVGVAELARHDPPFVSKVAGNRATLLVVEDETAVREVVVAMLRDLGYFVLEAGDGTEGLRVFQDNAGVVDMLLADVLLPGFIRGDELARRIAELRPGLPMLLMSAYTDDDFSNPQTRSSSLELLKKPFKREQLAFKVAEALANMVPAPRLAA